MARVYRCNHCNSEVETKQLQVGDSPVCPYCGKETKIQEIIEIDNPKIEYKDFKREEKRTTGNANDTLVDREFKTLLSYGSAISFIGWVIVIFAAIGLIISLSNRNIKVVGLMAAIPTAAFGIVIVSYGQLISCFVSIERNTKATLKAIQDSMTKG
jgi:NAD-dependent SIR2 family protein deacetylase